MSALDAVEAVGGARAPVATLQALADAMAALAPQGPGLAEESAAPRVETAAQAAAAAPAVPEAVLPVQPAEATTAAQGRLTLGQLATEQAALRAAPDASAGESARAALRAEPLADGGSARMAEMLAVPVLLNPLQPPAAPPARAPEAEAGPQRRAQAHDDDEAPPRTPEPAEDDAGPPDDEAAPEADPDAAALQALLRREQQADGLAELARGRRVLVVLPAEGAGHGIAEATAWLLGPLRAQRFGARWWPGAGQVGRGGWLHWRVFRDGDPLLSRGLASRAGGAACRVRLGAQPLRLADAEAAGLEIGDRIRFSQGLGGQWSVLVLAAPAGTAP